MNTYWNLAELTLHAQKNSLHERLTDTIKSLGRAFAIYKYHLKTAQEAMHGVINNSDTNDLENVLLASGISSKQDEFDLAKIVLEANIIASMHTTRLIIDIFSQLVNGIILNNTLSEAECDIKQVHKKLEPSEFKEEPSKLLTSPEFRYLDSFINTTKHRRLLNQNFIVSLNQGITGLKFDGFIYQPKIGNKNEFSSLWADEALEYTKRIHSKITDLGIKINQRFLENT